MRSNCLVWLRLALISLLVSCERTPAQQREFVKERIEDFFCTMHSKGACICAYKVSTGEYNTPTLYFAAPDVMCSK